jgi:hypothetical protein
MARNPYSFTNDAELLQVQLACLRMRGEGQSYRAIGEALGISHGTARNYTNKMLDEYKMPAVDEYRRQVLADSEAQLGRLITLRNTPQYVTNAKGEYAIGPDGEPILDRDFPLKVEGMIIKLRSETTRLLGANAPVQTEITVTEVTQTDLAIADLLNAQKAKNSLAKQALEANTNGSA